MSLVEPQCNPEARIESKPSSGGRPYQICTRTIMDTSDPNIQFDEQGICNHYYEYQKQEAAFVRTGQAGQDELQRMVKQIREFGRNRTYDCILGLSGGVDSTYLCLLAKQQGLRPLVVHFDNGWNSELAVNNIQNTVQKLGFDLYTYVVDWPEFRELQRSYFKANVVDIEVLTDHGFMAVLYRQARKHKIKYVLGGMNVVTEAILPSYWIYNKGDLTNIQNIQKRFGTIPIERFRSYPWLTPSKRSYIDRVTGMQVVMPLNDVSYRYEHVKEQIKSELDWRDYGGKHYESVFTRFYQGYILPNKFHFDKRRAHFSTLVCSGQMTRDEALESISRPGYDPDLCRIDMPFVLKKLGFTQQEFDCYLQAPRVEHSEYGTYRSWWSRMPWLHFLRPMLRKLVRPT